MLEVEHARQEPFLERVGGIAELGHRVGHVLRDRRERDRPFVLVVLAGLDVLDGFAMEARALGRVGRRLLGLEQLAQPHQLQSLASRTAGALGRLARELRRLPRLAHRGVRRRQALLGRPVLPGLGAVVHDAFEVGDRVVVFLAVVLAQFALAERAAQQVLANKLGRENHQRARGEAVDRLVEQPARQRGIAAVEQRAAIVQPRQRIERAQRELFGLVVVAIAARVDLRDTGVLLVLVGLVDPVEHRFELQVGLDKLAAAVAAVGGLLELALGLVELRDDRTRGGRVG